MRLAVVVALAGRVAWCRRRRRPTLAVNVTKEDLPPFFLIPPLCGSRLRAWSALECSGALEISPGDDVWVNAPLISTQPRCWLECARLWGEAMEDAPGCASRPDEGLDAINTLSQGLLGHFSHSMYEVIQALAGLGYDPTRLVAMPYDFRLTPDLLERRDGYFSRLKASIELETRRLGKRAVVLAHSLGCTLFAYFLEWLEHHCADSLAWLDDHVGLYFANGNPLLGSPDVATSLVVGAQQGMPISLKYIHEVLASAGGLLALAPRPLDVRSDDVRSDGVRSDDVRSDDVRSDGVRSDGVRSDGVRSDGVRSDSDSEHGDDDDDDDDTPPHLRWDVPWIKIASNAELALALRNNGTAPPRREENEILEFGPAVCDLGDPSSTRRLFADLGAALGDSHFQTLAAFVGRLCSDPQVGDVFRTSIDRPPIDSVHVAYGVGLPTRLSTTFELLPRTQPDEKQTPPYFADHLDPDVLAQKYDKPTRTWAVAGYVDEVGFRQSVLVDQNRRVVRDSHAPGKSGDDTVPYASLSAAHAWLGGGKGDEKDSEKDSEEDSEEDSDDDDDATISVRSVPLRKKFLSDEVRVGRYSRRHRAMKVPAETLPSAASPSPPTCAAGDDAKRCLQAIDFGVDDEPRLTVFESKRVDEATGAATRTTVMEMEGASHRGSANHPVYVEHLQLVLVDHILKSKDSRGEREDLTPDDLDRGDLSAILFDVEDFVPTDDSDCFWSFTNAACAYPGICEYQYKIGDLYLSQSCRLKRSPDNDDNHQQRRSPHGEL